VSRWARINQPPFTSPTNGREHQLLFFKERFLPKDHPDRPKMDCFSAKLRKLGLREETIGYGPSKEKWEEWSQSR
jgi:hypothetical protein